MSTDSEPSKMNETSAPSAPANRRWRYRIIIVLVAAVAIPLSAVLLYHHSPEEANSFWPGCTFYRTTGLHCPGCGATRCCYALLHGDMLQALAWNPLFVVLIPYMVYSLLRIAYSMWTGRRAPGLRMPARTGHVVLGLMLAYWVARNIPFEPFTWLAPHLLD